MIRLTSLLFEVSLDQLKTQFVDTGKITDSEFTEIIDSTGGKSAYATWLIKMVATKTINPEDLYKYNAYFKIFDRRKREYQFQDINQYKTPQDLARFIEISVEIANKEQRDPSQQKGVTKSDKYLEFYIGSIDGFNVYELPKGRKDLYGASCELGSGTQWCTATGKDRHYFDEYISAGPLFIFIQPRSDERYQFSYEKSQFMDKNDNDINQANYYNLFKFIQSKRPEYRITLKHKLLNDPDSITTDDLNVVSLNLSKETVKKLPDNLRITNNFDLYAAKIKSLPKNLHIGGNLQIALTPIESLPINLYVGENLYAYSSKLQSLPKNLYIGGDLWIMTTPLSEKYNETEIREMITSTGGTVKGKIRLN